MGGGSGPYVQGVILRGGREEEGGGEEQEPPDPGEAGEAEWEDIPSGEDAREAGRGTAGGARPTKTGRRPRSTKQGRLEKGRGEASAGGEGGGATSLGHPETVPDTSLLSQPRISSSFLETSTITTTIIAICEHALTGETCQINQVLYSVFQRGYPYRIFEILVVDQGGRKF